MQRHRTNTKHQHLGPLPGCARRRGTSRRGLAPLELVLWLPVLMFVAALIVNFGTMAAWRVRGEIVSRDAAWRVRWPRTGQGENRPLNKVWPEPAEIRVETTAGIDGLDAPSLQQPVVRGPLDNGWVVNNRLNPTQSQIAYRGIAAIERPYPMMASLGSYRSGDIQHFMTDGTWRIAQMGAPNVFRRSFLIYELPETEQSLPEAFARSVEAVTEMPLYEALAVLDDDQEFQRYAGFSPDFHPRVPTGMQELDRQVIYEAVVVPLIDGVDIRDRIVFGEISQLPRRMTQAFLNMYNAEIAEQEQLIDSLEQLQDDPATPPDVLAAIPGQIAGAEAIIAEIRPKVSQLEDYNRRLGAIAARQADAAREFSNASGIPLPLK